MSRPTSQAGDPHTSTADSGAQQANQNAAEKLNREALLLKAAQRSADRSAGQLESLQDL